MRSEAYQVTALEHLGNYKNSPEFAAFHELSTQAFSLFHQHVVDAEPRPLTDLIRRMMYIAEATSVAVRLNASWALTHPAYSLCRDRYEQCARFSWLARQTDDREWFRYVADVYVRRDRLRKAFANSGIDVPELANDAFDGLSDDQKRSFRHWGSLPLEQLVERRDGLAGITRSRLDRQTLRTFSQKSLSCTRHTPTLSRDSKRSD